MTRNGERLALKPVATCDIERFDPAGEGGVLTVSCGASYHGTSEEHSVTYRVTPSGAEEEPE